MIVSTTLQLQLQLQGVTSRSLQHSCLLLTVPMPTFSPYTASCPAVARKSTTLTSCHVASALLSTVSAAPSHFSPRSCPAMLHSPVLFSSSTSIAVQLCSTPLAFSLRDAMAFALCLVLLMLTDRDRDLASALQKEKETN